MAQTAHCELRQECAKCAIYPRLQTICGERPESRRVVYQGSGGFATAGAAGEVAGEVTGELIQLLKILAEPKTRTELQETLGLKGQANFRDRYLKPALDNGFIVMTNPKKPTSRLQKYRLTEKGRKFLELLEKGKGRS